MISRKDPEQFTVGGAYVHEPIIPIDGVEKSKQPDFYHRMKSHENNFGFSYSRKEGKDQEMRHFDWVHNRGYDFGYCYSYSNNYGESDSEIGKYGYFYLFGGCLYVSWSNNAHNTLSFKNNTHVAKALEDENKVSKVSSKKSLYNDPGLIYDLNDPVPKSTQEDVSDPSHPGIFGLFGGQAKKDGFPSSFSYEHGFNDYYSNYGAGSSNQSSREMMCEMEIWHFSGGESTAKVGVKKDFKRKESFIKYSPINYFS